MALPVVIESIHSDGQLISVSGQVSSLGNNLIITPTVGRRLRVYFVSYNPHANAECAFRFGETGGLFLRNKITKNSVISKDFGDFRFVQGQLNESLYLNLDGATTTNWNVNYIETI